MKPRFSLPYAGEPREVAAGTPGPDRDGPDASHEGQGRGHTGHRRERPLNPLGGGPRRG